MAQLERSSPVRLPVWRSQADVKRRIREAEEAAVSGGFMGASINVGEIYAYLVRDLQAGAYNTPDFEHAVHNARLIEAVKRAAELGERQKVIDQIDSFEEAKVTLRS